ncbi:MAG: HDIG domain-containing protein [Bacteroidales bacterium]|jgi:putative nucleotidyltransferase with HDIG domain|nr:HDIG domain-containing protein [Bacteroidales bacterium]
MANFLLVVRTHTHFILLYLASIAVVCFLFPREGKFPYEFQKGKIWAHSDLYASFDIPILKAQQEIDAEKDSLRNHFMMYYNYRAETVKQQIEQYGHTFDTHWGKSGLPSYRRFFLYRLGADVLDSVYRKGILQDEEPALQQSLSEHLTVIKNNVGEEVPKREVFTQKSAYETVMRVVRGLMNEDEKNFMKDLDLNNFIQPNLICNVDLTHSAQTESLRKISPTRGVIPLNRKIIARGEVVNDEKYVFLISMKSEFEHRVGHSGNFRQILAGQVCIVALCFLLVYLYLMHFQKDIFRNLARTGFLLLQMVLFIGVACFTMRNVFFNLYAIPFLLLPVIVATFFDARTSTFVFMVTILLIGLLAPNGLEFVILNFIAGVVSIANVRTVYRRGNLFKTVLWIFAVYSLTYTALFLMQGVKFQQIEWMNYIRFGISGILLFAIYPSIFIFEKIFGMISDITLMELSDTNQPLLRKLSEVAPGTFQHSLQVANIAEEVIQKIGGNPLLIRTGALYHDIGKISRPVYFIENQAGGHNPHDDLLPEDSARIIIEHVHNGVEIAKKNRVPRHIIDFIRTHHGTTTVRYFYHQYQLQYPDQKTERAKFTYPGPIPFSKEMVVLMMCDSIEAASRSLKERDKNVISELVDNVVNFQIMEDQFNDADITYRDINTAKQIIKNRLMSIYHVRIEYPKENNQKQK